MSSLIVEVCAVAEIAEHPNADRIERVRIKNWWCISGKGQYKVGDKVVFVPPDAVLPEALAERWGIAKYCAQLGKDPITGEPRTELRVRASRFRGVSSFGTIQTPDDPNWTIGSDVREYYGITKYDPPVKTTDGDAAPEVAAFHRYTDIENIGNFPGIFQDGEEVVVTEKLHGTNCRVGFVRHFCDESREFRWQLMAGSHAIRRKEFTEKGVRSRYWWPLSPINPQSLGMTDMFEDIKAECNATNAIICFGEIFGASVQDMQYGQKGLAFRIFDISVDGNYLDYDEMLKFVRRYEKDNLQTVPELYRGPFSMTKMDELVDGPTTVVDADQINESFKGREGIVIKPVKERFDGILGGRTVLKYISVDYHERKNKNRSEDH